MPSAVSLALTVILLPAINVFMTHQYLQNFPLWLQPNPTLVISAAEINMQIRSFICCLRQTDKPEVTKALPKFDVATSLYVHFRSVV
jgi:hypothetical protein